jgi:hypothetical protein
MLIYNPKGTSLAGPAALPAAASPAAGLPAAAPVTIPEAQTLVSDNAVSEILPTGGLKILNATEPLAQKVSKGAQDALAKTVTQVCLDGIRSMAIVKYVIGFAAMMAADRGKRSKDLLSVTARLRAWSVVSRANLVALSERDNPSVTAALDSLATTMRAVGISIGSVAGFLEDVKALQAAQADLLYGQTTKNFGGSFKLYEWHPVENTTSISWYGPAAIRPRVAKLIDNANTENVAQIKALFSKPLLDDAIPIDKVPVFPIPDIVHGTSGGNVNPALGAFFMAGFADILPFDEYQQDGINKPNDQYDMQVKLLNLSNTAPLGSGEHVVDSNVDVAKEALLSLAKEQLMRAYSSTMSEKAEKLKKQIGYEAKKLNISVYQYLWLSSSVWASFGDMIALGLKIDPEWGGSGFDDKKTYEEVSPVAVPLVRKFQDTYRNVLALKTEEGGKKLKPVGYYAKMLVKEGAIKSATTDMALVPVLPVSWTKVKSNPVLHAHFVDVSAWKKYVLNPDTEVNQSMVDSVSQWNADLWGGSGPVLGQLLDDMADCLTSTSTGKLCAWKPDDKGNLPAQLPYPLVYKYDAIAPKLPQYLTLSMGKYAEVSGKQITQEQQDLIDVRSEYKSTVLLAMRSAEFAGTVLDSTKALVQAIKNLTKILYGDCPIEEAPDDMIKEKLYAFYLKQTDACAASPKEGSLLDTLNKANELYKALLAKEAANDAGASQTLQVVAQQIAKTQERVNVLVAELKGKLQQVKGNIEDAGGLFYFIDNTVNLLNTIEKLPTSVVIGGVTYNAEPSQEEKDAIEETKKKIKKIQIEGFKIIGFVGAQAQTLTNVGDSFSIDFGTSVGGGLKDIRDWAVTTLGEEKPFPWWLLLLAAAAAAKDK